MNNSTNKKTFPRLWLWISIACLIISMIGASAVQTAGGTVAIKDLDIIANGSKQINAKIFIPKDASVDNKLPLIIVQHGSQHNLEMQDMSYVELSRRGYIVISADAYGHGSSDNRDGLSREQSFGSMAAIVEYAYNNLDIVDKTKIGLSGHSMGAGIVLSTVQFYAQQAALKLGPNKIAAALEIGYDPDYAGCKLKGVDQPVIPEINWGVIAGKYDEYFFRQKDVGGDPARILESAATLSFVQQVDKAAVGPVENGKKYKGDINGKEYIRAFYQSPETHPQNVFSSTTANSTIDFFYDALGTPKGHEVIAPANQVWPLKQAFNCLGLIAVFLFLFPFASWIMDTVPYFSVLKASSVPVPAPALNTGKKKIAYWLTLLISTAIPAVLAMPVMHYWIGQQSFAPMTANKWFGDGAVNEMAGWCLIVSATLLGIFLLNYFVFGKNHGATTESWGYKITLNKLWRSALLALMTFTVVCAILFFADFWFKTDFRFWLIALRVFTANKIMYWIAYVPAFALFYVVNSLLVDGGNRVEGMPDWVVTLISCLANVAGVAVLIAIQYINYAQTGTFIFNAMRTHNLFPLLVLVPAATIVSRKFFKKTGNIYLGAFTVSTIITIMTITQTSMTMSVLS